MKSLIYNNGYISDTFDSAAFDRRELKENLKIAVSDFFERHLLITILGATVATGIVLTTAVTVFAYAAALPLAGL